MATSDPKDVQAHAHPCPNCGHCPTCGRSNFKPYPYPYVWPYGTWPWTTPVRITYSDGGWNQVSGGMTGRYQNIN